MRSIAWDLDTGPASLYVHVRSMAELHGLMLDRILASITQDDGGTWRERICTILRRYVAVLMAYPEFAQVSPSRKPTGKNCAHGGRAPARADGRRWRAPRPGRVGRRRAAAVRHGRRSGTCRRRGIGQRPPMGLAPPGRGPPGRVTRTSRARASTSWAARASSVRSGRSTPFSRASPARLAPSACTPNPARYLAIPPSVSEVPGPRKGPAMVPGTEVRRTAHPPGLP